MSILKRKRNLIIAGLAVVGIIGAGSIAYAAFSSQTAANATGTSATLQALTVDTSNTKVVFANSETGLWPDTDGNGGAPASPGAGNHVAMADVPVANPNEVAVSVSSGDITGLATFNDGSIAGLCNPYLLVGDVTLVGGPMVLGAHGNHGDHGTLQISGVYLQWNAPNDCAGHAFTTNWVITAHQL